MSLFLLRHGETQFNREDRIQGWRDSALTETGIAQARRNGRVLAELLADKARYRIYSSPLGRALNTARLVAFELGRDAAEIRSDRRLIELSLGHWEGFTWGEVPKRFPEDWAARVADKWTYEVPGGESYQDMATRLASWLADHPDPAIAVTHGAAGRILRGLYAGLSREEMMTLEEPQDAFFELTGGEILRR
ncbi:MAG: histidine phosphatase family protein [Pseudomonadota bacterium]